jgi:sugar lactone lactonase YvrE
MRRHFAVACARGFAALLVPLLVAASGTSRANASQAPSTVSPRWGGMFRTPVHPLRRGRGWMSPAAKACKQKLYVSSYRLNYVSVYCTKGHNQPPIGQITSGIQTPEGANTDRAGNLYVTNTNANTVTEYAPGATTPSFTYSSGLAFPAGVAVDSSGNVYVSSLSPASVEVFAQGSNTPLRSMTDMTYPIDLALDPAGDLYVTTFTSTFGNGQILKYPPGGTTGTDLGILTGEPGGITLDASNDIVTADQRLPGVLVFPPGATQPAATFAQATVDPDPVRFSKNEKQVYVGDAIDNAVYVYAYPGGTLVDTITDGIDGPNGVALDPAAKL